MLCDYRFYKSLHNKFNYMLVKKSLVLTFARHKDVRDSF